MKSKIKDFISNDECIKLSFTLAQALDLETAAVLCETIKEYDYACANNFNMEEYFLVNIPRLSQVVNINETRLHEVLKFFLDLGILHFCPSGVNNTFLVRIYDEKILELIEYYKPHCILQKWESDLKITQNPVIENTHFNNAIKTLYKFVQKNIKNSEKIPMVIYASCNVIIENFNIGESFGKAIEQDKNVQNQIVECINYNNFKPADIVSLTETICKDILIKRK